MTKKNEMLDRGLKDCDGSQKADPVENSKKRSNNTLIDVAALIQLAQIHCDRLMIELKQDLNQKEGTLAALVAFAASIKRFSASPARDITFACVHLWQTLKWEEQHFSVPYSTHGTRSGQQQLID